MIKYILLSGTSKTEGFYLSQIPYLQKAALKCKIITFIPTFFDKFAINDKYANNIILYFKNIGINFTAFFVLDERMTERSMHENIKKADIIYIMGGVPNKQMKNLNKYHLPEILKDFKGPIVGASAGSINMNKHVVYEDGDIITYDGIGLTSFNIAPHFSFEKDDYVEEVKRVSKITKTIALFEESLIIADNVNYKIIGEYHIFENGENIHSGGNKNER